MYSSVITLAVLVFVVLCVLLSIALKRQMPLHLDPPAQVQHRINPSIITRYRHLVQSTLGWLDRYGLPISRFTRAILGRVFPSDGNGHAFDDAVEPYQQDLGRVALVDLEALPPVHH